MKKSKQPIKLASLGVALYYIWIFCIGQTHGFTISRVASQVPFDSAWETTMPETREIHEILKQKFTYLDDGGQSFAFVSQDNRYVLKLFKMYRTRMPSYVMMLPLPQFLDKRRQKKLEHRTFRIQRDFTSYSIAFNELQLETGLICVHLNKTQNLLGNVTITDNLGIEHTLNLDKFPFVLQKRLDRTYEKIDTYVKNGQLDKAKHGIDEMLQLIINRSKKGIYDEDAVISRNFGFDGDKPVFLDVGRFRKDPACTQPAFYKRDIAKITRRFKIWLQNNHPELATYLENQINSVE